MTPPTAKEALEALIKLEMLGRPTGYTDPYWSVLRASIESAGMDTERLDGRRIVTMDRDEFGEICDCLRLDIDLRAAIDEATRRCAPHGKESGS